MFSIILYSTAALLILPSILLLRGKGAFLIAGYNTASPEQKAAIDEKKLCRVTGGGLLVCGILVLFLAILGENTPPWFTVVFIIVTMLDVIVMIWLTNTKCRLDVPRGITDADRRKSRRTVVAALAVSAAIALPLCATLFTGDIAPEYSEDSIRIRASYWSDLTMRYEDITAIQFREEAVPGSRTGGFGSPRLLMGSFHNQEFGTYTRYTYTGCDACVVLTYQGSTVVLGGADDAASRAIYDQLCRRVAFS